MLHLNELGEYAIAFNREIRLGNLYHIDKKKGSVISTAAYKTFFMHPRQARLVVMYDICEAKNIILKLYCAGFTTIRFCGSSMLTNIFLCSRI